VRFGESRRADRTGPAGSAVAASALASLAAAALASLAAAACSRDPVPRGELTPEVSTMLGHLPGDARAIIGINSARARKVPSLGRLLAWLPDAPLDPALAGACALDPDRAVDQVVATIGPAGADGAERLFVAMKGGFTRESIASCLARSDREARPAITLEGAVTAYTAQRAKRYIYWPAGDVAIVSPDAPDSRAALDQLIAGGQAKQDARLMSYVSRVRTGAAFWMAGPMPPRVVQRLAGLGPSAVAIEGFFVSVDGEDGEAEPIRLLVGLRLGGVKHARAAERAFRLQRAELARAIPDERAGAIVNRLEISRSGAEVALRASLTGAESEMLLDVLTPFLP
jgi:hypothetical protein